MMWFRIRHTSVAAGVLLSAYLIYSGTIGRLLTPPPINPVPLKIVAAQRSSTNLADLFGPQAWQNGSCKRFQTPDAMLLFENWEQRGQNAWKVWPVTMVFGRGMSGQPSEHPIVLQSSAGAEIEFAGSLDHMGEGAPPIKKGRLIGDVTVNRDDGERKFSVETRDIVIERNRLYTTQSVNLQMGDATLQGRDLTLHLAGGASGAGGGSHSEIVPDRLELIYLDRIHLPLESLSESAQSPGPTDSKSLSENDSTNEGEIEITSGGRVEFDFAIGELSLSGGVLISRQRVGLPTDRFAAEVLRMTLDDPLVKKPRTELADWIIAVDAIGNPVRMDVPSFEVAVAAGKLNWQIREGTFHASGPRGIDVRRGGIQARLAGIEYRYDVENPKRIGLIQCSGAGIVQSVDDALAMRSARWTESLNIQSAETDSAIAKSAGGDPVDPNDSRVPLKVRVAGNCQFEMKDGGTARADQITGWLVPDTVIESSGYLPDRIVVEGDIQVDTPSLMATAELMRLYFLDDPQLRQQMDRAKGSTGAAQSNEQNLATSTAVSQPAKVSNPTFGKLAASRQGDGHSTAETRPRIHGKIVDAQLMRTIDGYSPRNVSVKQDVEITNSFELAGRLMPGRLVGQLLQWSGNPNTEVLQLLGSSGAPARFDIEDGFFMGPEIQIRPADNLIQIDDAGQFKVPTSLIAAMGTEEGGGDVRWTHPPHCHWRGQMLFDGRTVRLDGGVNIKAQLVQNDKPWDIDVRGEQLNVLLVEAIRMNQTETMRDAQIESVVLSGNPELPVLVAAHSIGPGGDTESKHQFHAPTLRLIPAAKSLAAADTSARLVGSGPGWYRGWMLGQKDEPEANAAGRLASSRTDGTSKIESDPIIRGIHLTYDESMDANISQRDLRFNRGVRLAMQELPTMQSVFDIRDLHSPPNGTSMLDCDSLRLAMPASGVVGRSNEQLQRLLPGEKISNPNPSLEINADGSIVFQTRGERGLYTGTASTATYSSVTDLFTAKGVPGRPATFRQMDALGNPGWNTTLKFIAIRPQTMEIMQWIPIRMTMQVPENQGR